MKMKTMKTLTAAIFALSTSTATATVSNTGQAAVILNGRVLTFGDYGSGNAGPTGDNYTQMYDHTWISPTTPYDLGVVNANHLIDTGSGGYQVVIKKNGLAYYWGGCATNNSTVDCATPHLIPTNNILDVATGSIMGNNEMNSYNTLILRSNPDGVTGTAYLWHNLDPNRPMPVQQGLPTDLVAVQWLSGGYGIVAVDSAGKVWRRVPGADETKWEVAQDFIKPVKKLLDNWVIYQDGTVATWGTATENEPWWISYNDLGQQKPSVILPEFSDIVDIGGIAISENHVGYDGGVYFVKANGTVSYTYGSSPYAAAFENYNVVNVHQGNGFMSVTTADGKIYSTQGAGNNRVFTEVSTTPTRILWTDPESTPADIAIYCSSITSADPTYFPVCAPNDDAAVASYIQHQSDAAAAQAAQDQMIQYNANHYRDLQSKYDTAQADADAAKADLAKAQADLAKAKADADAAKADLAKAQADLAKAKADLTAAQNSLTTAQNDVATLKADADAAKADLAKAQADLTIAQSSLTAAQSNYAKAKSDLDVANLSLTSTQAERDAAQAAEAKAKSDLATAQANLISSQTLESKAKADLAKTQADLMSAQAASMKAQSDLAEANTKVTTLTADRDAQKTKADKATADLAILQASLDKQAANEQKVSESKVKGIKSAYKAFLKAKANLQKAINKAVTKGQLNQE
ncbi:MAG: hypothetical protein QXN55_00170 [Candidatus Nitrosotenuis sp.]